MKYWAFIFARGGSKGLPGKNLMDLCGKPLIAHAIGHALQSTKIDRVFVSTDSEEIAEAARQAGAEVPFIRPPELAQDNSPEWLAWQHAINYVRQQYGDFDVFVSVPATAPCRDVADVDRCIDALSADNDIIITITESNFNPYFTMVALDQAGQARLFNHGEQNITRRQDAPLAYGIVPIAYVSTPDFVLGASGVWDGRVGTVEVAPLTAIDIDRSCDMYLAELIMKDQSSTI